MSFWVSYGYTDDVAAVFSSVYPDHAPGLLSESFVLGGEADHSQALADTFESALERSGSFDNLTTLTYPGERVYAVDEWLDALPTHSDHRLLSPTVLTHLTNSLRDGLQALGATFTVHLTTHLVTARTHP